MHVNRAYDHYIRQSQDIWPDSVDEENAFNGKPRRVDRELTPEHLAKARAVLKPYEKFTAIANYGSGWHCRTTEGKPWFSSHGVDVMHHTFHCGGSARAMLMMFHVAGFRTRQLGWNCHLSTEVKVGRKWIFADMIVRNGAHYRSTHSWAELTADPDVYPTAVLSYMRSPTARGTHYRHAAGMYWHGMSGISKYDESMGHRTGAIILSYLPNIAGALYPSMRLHVWHIAEGDPPSLTICAPSSGGRYITLAPGTSVRKRFWLSHCADNPIAAGVAGFSMRGVGDGNAQTVRCELDGRDLGVGFYAERYWRFNLPVDALTPGEHELVLRNDGEDGVELRVYPDMVRPYLYPVSGAPIEITSSGDDV